MTPHSLKTPLEKVRAFYAGDVRLSFKIIASSIAVIAISAAPILLYAVFGPEDGNPLGLGLIFMLGIFLGQLGLVVGFLRMLWEFFTGHR
ncbi:MAG TPA: hypothetical protein VF275_07050 [Gammaproteobacteria bacterium]